MNIQEVVTHHIGTLEKVDVPAETLPAVLQRHHDASEILVLGRTPLPQNTDDVRRQVASLASRFAAIERTAELTSSAEIFAALLQFLEDHSYRTNLEQTIRTACNRLELATLIREHENKIYFLDYMWEDELEAKIADFTNTNPSTVRQWIDGKLPAGYNSEMLLAATTVLFQLHRECGMSKEEAVEYFETVRFGHSDDRRLSKKSLWEWIARHTCWMHKRIYFEQDLRDHIENLGGDTAVFDHDFRFRFLVS